MRITKIAVTAGLLALVSGAAPALAQDQATRIAVSDNCFVMKQRVLAVASPRVAVVVNPGQPNTVTSNRSGSTARSEDAAANAFAGDSACENNDLASAREYYQKAIDDLTAED